MTQALLLRLLVLGLSVLALGACDDGFTPTIPDSRAFSVFGFLDGSKAQQRIRVEDLAIPITGTPDALPATVVSTELGSGVQTAWRDSLVTLADGTKGHLFVADLAVAQGETHRIALTRDSDGATSTVTVTLPSPTSVVDVAGVGGAPQFITPVDIVQLGGPAVDGAVRYTVERPGSGPVEELVFTVPSADQPFTLNLGVTAAQAVRRLYGSDATGPVLLLGIDFQARVRSTDERPVTNGVGGVEWTIPVVVPIGVPRDLVEQAGFVDGR